MDLQKALNKIHEKYVLEKKRRGSLESKFRNSQTENKKLRSILAEKESIDITSTIHALHELRKINRKLDIYHVAVLSYASEVGKFTSSQFMRRMHSGKNKFYEVMVDMKELGYITTTETSYKHKRIWFYLTTKGYEVVDRLKKSVLAAKLQSKRERKLDGKA